MNSYWLSALGFLAGVGCAVLVLGPTVRRAPIQTARIENLQEQLKVCREVEPRITEELLSKYNGRIDEIATALNSCRAEALSRGEDY